MPARARVRARPQRSRSLTTSTTCPGARGAECVDVVEDGLQVGAAPRGETRRCARSRGAPCGQLSASGVGIGMMVCTAAMSDRRTSSSCALHARPPRAGVGRRRHQDATPAERSSPRTMSCQRSPMNAQRVASSVEVRDRLLETAPVPGLRQSHGPVKSGWCGQWYVASMNALRLGEQVVEPLLAALDSPASVSRPRAMPDWLVTTTTGTQRIVDVAGPRSPHRAGVPRRSGP